jgi:hypothetical protein
VIASCRLRSKQYGHRERLIVKLTVGARGRVLVKFRVIDGMYLLITPIPGSSGSDPHIHPQLFFTSSANSFGRPVNIVLRFCPILPTSPAVINMAHLPPKSFFPSPSSNLHHPTSQWSEFSAVLNYLLNFIFWPTRYLSTYYPYPQFFFSILEPSSSHPEWTEFFCFIQLPTQFDLLNHS